MNATYWLVETIGDEDQALGEHGACIYQHTKKKYLASSFHFSHLFSFTFCLRCTILFFFKRRCEMSKSNSSSKFKVSFQVLTFDLFMFFSFFHFACVYAQRHICEAMKEGGGFSIIFIFILLLII